MALWIRISTGQLGSFKRFFKVGHCWKEVKEMVRTTEGSCAEGQKHHTTPAVNEKTNGEEIM